jgi:hypothetical protein
MKCTEKIMSRGDEAMDSSEDDLPESAKRSRAGTPLKEDDGLEDRELQAELALLGPRSRSRIAQGLRSQTPVERRQDKPQVPGNLPGLRELPDQRKEREDRELEAEREAIGLRKEQRTANYEYRSYSETMPLSPLQLDADEELIRNHRTNPFIPPIDEDRVGNGESPDWNSLPGGSGNTF